MSYHTGSINSTTPNTDLMAALDTPIVAHAAWEFVETVTSGTRITNIYKCLGSVNSFGTDFYIGICRVAVVTSGVGFIIGETYDSGTKKLGSPGVYCSTATALTLDSVFKYNTPMHVADETTLVASTDGFLRVAGAGSVSTPTHIQGLLQASATAYNWSMSITNDRICFSHSIVSAFNASVYVGLYDSFHSTSVDVFPLYCGGMFASVHATSGNDTILHTVKEAGCYTRDISSGSVTGAMMGSFSAQSWTWNAGAPNLYSTVISKEPFSQRWWPSRVMLVHNNRGAIRGLAKDVVQLIIGETAEGRGDTATIDGVVYSCFQTGAIVVRPSPTSGTAVQQNASYWVSTAI